MVSSGRLRTMPPRNAHPETGSPSRRADAVRSPAWSRLAVGAVASEASRQAPLLVGDLLSLQALAGNGAIGGLLGFTRAGPTPRSGPASHPVVQRIVEPVRPVLRLGARGPDVEALQDDLGGLIYPPPERTGRFDRQTREAVVEFQRDNGIEPNGVVGALTFAAIDRALGRAPAAAPGPDLHAGTARPGTTELENIRAHLNPTSTGPTGTPEAWDGAGTDDAARANREALRTDLTSALDAHLAGHMPGIRTRASARALPMASFEGAGRQAKRLVDDTFGEYATAAILTRSQERTRAAFSFTAGVNLLDASDPGVRPPDAADTASWMAETDADARAIQQGHHFDPDRSVAERTFLNVQILRPFVSANRPDLELYDRFGFAIASGGQVMAQPSIVGSARFPDVPPDPDTPSPAERRERWDTWEILVHEYIHTLEHPAFSAAHRNRRIMFEGFCELFTKEVLLNAIPMAQDDLDPVLRGGVEGTASDGSLFTGFARDFVRDYDPGEYEPYLLHAEGVRDAIGPAGPEAVKAAFFQGHVELIGLTPVGAMATAPTGGTEDLVRIPSTVRGLSALSVMTGASESDILAANPGLTADGPLPAEVHVPGVSYHVVVAATDLRGGRAESRREISLQHGVSEAALDTANPGLNWSFLRPGRRVLVPVH